ncbi:hypothetical protein SLEP1_g42283 [Rubroshorea leprosula]|uniref:C2H2-type domain-containing protein n=1 Tax=Rubroshorea leprosula TaxID=152421 RepID=A0AAV5L9B7_9ROSI|nr:hypothetical protein SLEP1_g42283 [Rubroshorea leprosula]
MDRRICKICSRSFANGKAMGGHMRSHLAKLPITPKPNPNPLPLPNYPTSSQNSPPEKSDLADKESDTDLPRDSNQTRRRSKRHPNCAVDKVQLQVQLSVHPEAESVSSITEAFPDEEVAMCLLMLKTDKWTKGKNKEVKRAREEVNEEEDDGELFCITHARSGKTHNKYKCGTCKKKFRSYQALGGHKASHKNIKSCNLDEDGFANGDVILRNFECPFCDKVFESGQALGGHKKVHFSYLTVAKKSPEKSRNQRQQNFLDLNMVPDEDEVSQVECSTV